jgi:hypothetical protein
MRTPGGKTTVRRLILAAAAIVTVGFSGVAVRAVDAVQPLTKVTVGSKWTLESQWCPIREVFGSSGHVTLIVSGPRFHESGTYRTKGTNLREKVAGNLPGSLTFVGTWSKTQKEYVGTMTNGANTSPAIVFPGMVNGCPTY